MVRLSREHDVVLVVTKQKEMREFLVALAPFLEGQPRDVLITFLSRFTHTNLVRWDEGERILGLALSPLKDLALRRLYEVPLPYLKQQAPPSHYDFLRNAKHVRMSSTQYLGTKVKETQEKPRNELSIHTITRQLMSMVGSLRGIFNVMNLH